MLGSMPTTGFLYGLGGKVVSNVAWKGECVITQEDSFPKSAIAQELADFGKYMHGDVEASCDVFIIFFCVLMLENPARNCDGFKECEALV